MADFLNQLTKVRILSGVHMNKLYVTVVDSKGAIRGTEYVPISHRFLYENKQLFGYDSLRKFFSTPEELTRFLKMCIDTPQGELQQLSWFHG